MWRPKNDLQGFMIVLLMYEYVSINRFVFPFFSKGFNPSNSIFNTVGRFLLSMLQAREKDPLLSPFYNI